MPEGKFDSSKSDRARLWLYQNKYWKHERHPVLTGPGEISRVALRRIVEVAKETGDDVIRLRCASWNRTSRNGNDYTYVTIEPEEKKEEEQLPPQNGSANKVEEGDDVPF